MPGRFRLFVAFFMAFSAPALAQTTVLDSSADWIVAGDQPTGTFGARLAPAGDVDGDGYDDVLIGDALYDGAFVDSGRITLHRGSAAGLSLLPDWSLEGGAASAGLSSAFGAGDVNTDGFDDIVIQRTTGQLDLLLGSPGGPSASPAWTTIGSYGGHGDFNGDGFVDLVVSLPPSPQPPTSLQFFMGSGVGLPSSATASLSIPQLSSYVPAIADVNGDGYSDTAVIWRTCSTNCSRVTWTLAAYLGSDLGPRKLVKRHIDIADPTGVPSLTEAGDVNGDGFGDLAVTVNVDIIVDINQSAKVLLFHGSRSGIESQPDLVWASSYGRMGLGPIRGAGDLHGDGFADLLVPDYDPVPGTGTVLSIRRGSASGVVATPSLRIREEQRSASGFALAASGVGDVNGDGYGDFVFSAPRFTIGGLERGRVYAFHGSPSL